MHQFHSLRNDIDCAVEMPRKLVTGEIRNNTQVAFKTWSAKVFSLNVCKRECITQKILICSNCAGNHKQHASIVLISPGSVLCREPIISLL